MDTSLGKLQSCALPTINDCFNLTEYDILRNAFVHLNLDTFDQQEHHDKTVALSGFTKYSFNNNQ